MAVVDIVAFDFVAVNFDIVEHFGKILHFEMAVVDIVAFDLEIADFGIVVVDLDIVGLDMVVVYIVDLESVAGLLDLDKHYFHHYFCLNFFQFLQIASFSS